MGMRAWYNADMICRFSTDAVRRELTPIDNLFLSEFLPDADGDAVKVYLYGLMQCYHAGMRDVSIDEALTMSPSQVLCAFKYWSGRGLVRITSEDPLTVEYLLTEQPAVTTATAVKYRGFVRSLNSLLDPRTLAVREMKYIYECIEDYGLDEAAVLELVSHCIEQKGKKVSVNYIASVARDWSERGIITCEQARAYIDDYRVKKHGASEVLRRWNKRRKPTRDEMDMYDRWIREWGFDGEAILAVCPQLTGVGTPTFEILGDRLYALYLENKTHSADIQLEQAAVSDDKAFTRQVFARLGKVEPPTRTHVAQIGMFLHEKDLPREVILLAADQCAAAERPLGLLKTILSEWATTGVKTVEQAKSRSFQTPSARSARVSKKAHGYAENPLTDEDIKHLIVDLNEDI